MKKSVEQVKQKVVTPNPVTKKGKALEDAPKEYYFKLHDGRLLKNLFDLVDELEKMPDDAFGRYANAARNDFATWIKDIFNEDVLAVELKKVGHKLEAQRVLLKHLLKEVMAKSKPA